MYKDDGVLIHESLVAPALIRDPDRRPQEIDVRRIGSRHPLDQIEIVPPGDRRRLIDRRPLRMAQDE